MASLHVFILLSLTGTIYGLPQNPAARDIREVSAGDITEDVGDMIETANANLGRTRGGTHATSGAGDITEDVGDMIETANANLGRTRGGPHIMFGDIAMSNSRTAHPCTRTGCLWPAAGNGKVYIPVIISRRFSREEQYQIIRGLVSFHQSTCIRFVWRRRHTNYLYFYSGNGCWSYPGRQQRGQLISLNKGVCLSHGIIQHEVLHALGFAHEQNRSDRDKHVTVVTKNIRQGQERNFLKMDTNNLATPYDYNSVMHYGRYVFSKQPGRLPTIVAKPDASVPVGGAKAMNSNDILRVNKLYCNK